MGFGSRTPTGASSPGRRLERTYRPPSARISSPLLPPLRVLVKSVMGYANGESKRPSISGHGGSPEALEDAGVGVERRLPAEVGVEADRLDRLLVGDAVAASVPLVQKNDLLVLDLPAEADRRGSAPRDPRDLLSSLLDRRRRVDPR